jgi:hypothetical protein
MTEILNPILTAHGLGEVRPGTLTLVNEATVFDAAEAMRRFLSFGGQGWLCTAESRSILHTQPGGAWPPPASAWALQGEVANGLRSLHLRRTPAGWHLATLEEIEATPAAGATSCLVDSYLHTPVPALRLCYTVAWFPVWIGTPGTGHEELRPAASRFTGFQPRSHP